MTKRFKAHDMLAHIAERNHISKRLHEAGAPQVGVFWFVQDVGQPPQLFAWGVFVQQGKTNGIYITSHMGHASWWRNIKRNLHFAPGSPFSHSGPNDWPRGQVVFNTVLKRFEVYFDKQLQTPQFEAEILSHFRLPKSETSFALHPDDANARFTLGPEGPQERPYSR